MTLEEMYKRYHRAQVLLDDGMLFEAAQMISSLRCRVSTTLPTLVSASPR